MNSKIRSVLIMSSVRWYNASAHYALSLAAGLKKAGINAVLFGIPGSPVIEKAKKAGLPVIENINLMDKNPFKYIINIYKFNKIAAENKFDILNPHISRDHTFAFISLQYQKIPLIRTRTDSIPPKNNIFNRYFYSRSACHYIVSSVFMTSFSKNSGIDNKKISVIPLEMNYREFANFTPKEDLRKKLKIPAGRIIVAFIGRLDNVKGVEYFVKSHPHLKNREKVHYLISGEEINISIRELRKLAVELNIENISIIGRADDAREILNITDIGVIPSIGSEAICRIALEMLAFGIPVIGSNINSIPETIKEYYGITVKPGQPAEIAGAIDSLISDDNYKKLKHKILQKVAEKSPDRFINEYIDVFSKQI